MTTAWSPPRAPVFRLAALVIAGASRLVPVRRRAEWRLEWEAELWHRVARLRERGHLDRLEQLRLLHRCLGAYRHALWVLGRDLRPARLAAGLTGAAEELRATPARSAVAILGVGLALGAGGLAFTVADRVRAGTAPYPGHERTAWVFNSAPAADLDRTGLSRLELARFRAGNHSFESLAGFRRAHLVIEAGGIRRPVRGARVTPDWFRAVGVEPGTIGGSGPGFEAASEEHPVAVIREDLWLELAGSRGPPAVVTVGGESLTVVGVLPATFGFPDSDTRIWLPLRIAALSPVAGERSLAAVGRMRPGVTAAEARLDLQRLSTELQAERPEGYFGVFGVGWGVEVSPVGAVPRDQVPLLFLLSGAGAMLILAGATAAGALARQPASGLPGGLNSAILAAAAALVAAVVLTAGLQVLSGEHGPWGPGGTGALSRDAAGYLALGAALVVGFRRVARRRWRDSALVGLSVGLAIVLLAGAGVAGAAYRHLLAPAVGYDPEGLVALRSLEGALGPAVARRAERVPGIVAATLASSIPDVEFVPSMTLVPENGPTAGGPPPGADLRAVGRGYFDVMRMPLIAGRTFDPAPPGLPVNQVIVSRTLADRFWPGGSALGRRLMVPRSGATGWLTVVGVVADQGRRGTARRPVAEIYLPPGPGDGALPVLVLRTALAPAMVTQVLRRHGVIGEGTFAPPSSVQEVRRAAAAPYRIGTRLLDLVALAAGLAAAIACAAAPRRTALGGLGLGAVLGGLGVWFGVPAAEPMLGTLAASPVVLGVGAAGVTAGMLMPFAAWRWKAAAAA